MVNRKMTLSKTKLVKAMSSGMTAAAKLKAKQIGVAAALMFSAAQVNALGLGSLEIASNLDQPLDGVIELRLSQGDDLSSLKAVIASEEDFESLGIDYPAYMRDIDLSVDQSGSETVLRVNSNNVVIKEPFIHFLVRVEWSGGSFLREYTALIDPPVYGADTPQSAALPREVGTDQSYQSGTIEAPEASSDVYDQVATTDQTEYQEPVVEEAPLVEDNFYEEESSSSDTDIASNGATDARYGPVASGESLSVIAQDLQNQFPDLSIYQIMKVLFEENQDSFIAGNINGLIQGSILNIGDLNAIRAVDIEESKSFYRTQIADWDPSSLISSRDDSVNVGQDEYNFDDDNYSDSADTSFDSTTQDSFQVGASSENEDFVSSDQGNNNEAEVLALRQEVSQLQSSLASSDLEKQELNERISLLEGQLADMNRLIDLNVEDAELANLESTLAAQNNENDVEEPVAYVDATVEDNSAIDEFLSDTGTDAALDEFAADDVTSDSDVASSDDDLLAEFADSSDAVVDDSADAAASDGAASDGAASDGAIEDAAIADASAEADGFESVIEEAVDTATPVEAPAQGLVVEKPVSFLDKAKSALFEGGLWKVLAGLGALLVGGLGLLFFRRRQADEEFEISMLSIESNSHSVGNSEDSAESASMSASHTASMASEATSPDKETSFLTVYSDSDAVVQADEVDPVAEADVYIAYGRDEQAEEVLLDGVASHPERVDIKRKLLNLYYKRQNAEGFERMAEELYGQRAALTGDVWQEVSQMGKEIAPDNPLFELSGDDLETAVEADSELSLEGDDITEVPLTAEAEESEPEQDDAQEEPSSEEQSDELLIAEESGDVLEFDSEVGVQADAEVGSEASSAFEELDSVDEEDAESVLESLSDDASIQLINFDDGRSEISELDEVEIDALELSDDLPESLELGNNNDEQAQDDNVIEISLNDGEDDDLLEFDLAEAGSNDDAEQDVGEVQEVSDLEIDPDYDEARTQYELAKVFVDLGDEDGARKILDELVANEENSAEVLEDSRKLLDSINS